MTRAKSNLELITYKSKHHKNVKISRFVNNIYQIMNPDESLNEPKQQSAYNKIKNKEILNLHAIADANELKQGIDVKHSVIGRGKIISISHNEGKIKYT